MVLDLGFGIPQIRTFAQSEKGALHLLFRHEYSRIRTVLCLYSALLECVADGTRTLYSTRRKKKDTVILFLSLARFLVYILDKKNAKIISVQYGQHTANDSRQNTKDRSSSPCQDNELFP